ncbi:uncharacterized protein LOC128963808 [Oppia nitens]|uniref:uncharacterized protein LOC128963808 n=1 Tax=Oppia nitens TaxID=1686743 RepID=UPI0023D9FB16|nr:uncharacterized protein LOC128963808 [Oppia nitens]
MSDNSSVRNNISDNTRYDSILKSLIENPYALDAICRQMDIKSLANCIAVNREFHDAAQKEMERRPGLKHLFLRHNQDIHEDMRPFANAMTNWINSSIEFKPCFAFIQFGGYKHSPDYRKWINTLTKLTAGLPNGCQIMYLDVGPTVRLCGQSHNSMTIATTSANNQLVVNPMIRSSMSCLLVSDIKGIQINTYRALDDIVDTSDIKCILYLKSSKVINRSAQLSTIVRDVDNEIRVLKQRFNGQVVIGGGLISAAKCWLKGEPPRVVPDLKKPNNKRRGLDETVLTDPCIITFRGPNILAASLVLPSSHYYLNNTISQFKARLNPQFTKNSPKSITQGILFASKQMAHNQHIHGVITALRQHFPSVALFSFRSKKFMIGSIDPIIPAQGGHWGQRFAAFNNYPDRPYQILSPRFNSVLVLINYHFN